MVKKAARIFWLLSGVLIVLGTTTLFAQDTPAGGAAPTGRGAGAEGGRGAGRGTAGASTGGRNVDVTSTRNIDKGAVERGTEQFGNYCGSCHGTDARGGTGKADVDLVRSVLVLDDLGGKQIGEFLKAGHPAKNKTVFPFADAHISDIAAFLHNNVSVASERGAYKYLDVLVGNAKAGEAYFNGTGGCKGCHSIAGDLKGVGAKYDPATLQMIIVTGGGGGGRGGRGRGNGSAAAAKTVTVTDKSGNAVKGTLVTISDFIVTLREPSGAIRSFFRDGDTPKVVIVDPLQAHLDLMRKYTDDDMHNLTAYLATLK
jgi:cytochrome c oxidase cbb3-type subunit III